MIRKLFRPLAVVLLLMVSQQAAANEWIYTFRPGDTLWDLCEKYIAAPDCWKKIATRNKVSEPRQIKPGTRLYLPIAWLKVLPASAKVLSTRGDVTVKRADTEDSVALDDGAEILVGDAVITNEGTATLQFADESILIITPGSEVLFDTLTLYGESGMVDTRVRLNRGRARARVKPVEGPASRYEILTPAAVAAVRGTEFRVVSEATDPPQMRTEVLEGKVAVANDEGEQNVEQGYALKAVSGESPAEPVKLLPAPALTSALPETVSAFPLGISWRPIDGAAAYRLQIYRSGLLFDDLLQEQRLEKPAFAIPKLEEGKYEVAVRAIDNNGFEGMEATHSLNVVAPREFRPVTVDVSLQSDNGNQSLVWQWPEVEGAGKYIVEVTAENGQAAEQRKRIEVVDNRFVQGVSEPGVYHLKVAPVSGGQVLAFSDAATYKIRDANAPPMWVQTVVGLTLLIIIF